jgi:hypothetical protein
MLQVPVNRRSWPITDPGADIFRPTYTKKEKRTKKERKALLKLPHAVEINKGSPSATSS